MTIWLLRTVILVIACFNRAFHLTLLVRKDLGSISCFAEICIVSHVCPQASIYDNAGLYGSGYSSKAVSLLHVCKSVSHLHSAVTPSSQWNPDLSLPFLFLLLHLLHPLPFHLLFTALWIQLVLLWSQLYSHQPCGEHPLNPTLHEVSWHFLSLWP